MSQKAEISYALYPESLSATGFHGGEISKITYVDHPDVRDAVMTLMDAVSSGYEKEIFSHVCGRCGQCCINRTVLVNAREIMAISRHLDISEAHCRERYVIPAATWNEQDGTLARKGEQCVFLEHGSSGACKCAIYEARPPSCREPAPELKYCCSKDPGKLLTCVEKLEIGPQGLTCHLASGNRCQIEHRTPDLQDALRKFDEAVRPCLGADRGELNQMTHDTHYVLDWLLSRHRAGMSLEILMPRLLAMEKVVDDIDTLTPLREKDPEDLQLLWSKIRHLRELFARNNGESNGNEAVQENKGASHEEMPVVICFLPAALAIETMHQAQPVSATLHYHHHPSLLRLVRTFIETLITSGEPGLVDALGHAEPYCIQCGACCGASYDLEITAVDIERIADHLEISEKQLRETYLEPARRSWNRRDGLIRKQEIPGHEGECVFLETKGPTESKCRIYQARSQMCRDYPVSNRLCRKKSLLLKGYEHIGNIISCRVADDIVHLTTQHTLSHDKKPFATALKDNERLREAFCRIKAEALQILS